MVRVTENWIGQHDRLEKLAAIDERSPGQVVTVEINEIEGEEVQSVRLVPLDGLVKPGAVLQKLETGRPVSVEGHNFAVDNCALRLDALRQRLSHFRKLFVQRIAPAGEHTHRTVFDE